MKKALSIVLLLLVIIGYTLLNYRPRPDQLQQYLVDADRQGVIEDTTLTVQFLGNTNLLFSDGQTSILTDGFFSNPSVYKVLYSTVAPDRGIIQECLDRADITRLDAVIPVHSHFDHAMDAPMVADMTGAQLIGSSSTANIGLGYGLDEQQIIIPELNSTLTIGKFEITFIKSNHWQYPDAEQRAQLLNNSIDTPLITPTSIYDYKEGISYTLLIRHQSTTMAVQGSAGYVANSIPVFEADVLFLSIAGLDAMSEAYNQDYQDHLIAPLRPETLVPIHWDDFTVRPSAKPLKTHSLLATLMFQSNLAQSFEQIEKRNPNRAIKVLPTFRKILIKNL